MRILFLGDVMGRSGRRAIGDRLAPLRERLKADLVVVNAENASGGRGVTAGHAQLLLDSGADCLTLGDHAFDQKDLLSYVEREPRIIRPLNYAREAPGRGHAVVEDRRGRKVLVAQALGQVFMSRPYDDPFSALDTVLRAHEQSLRVLFAALQNKRGPAKRLLAYEVFLGFLRKLDLVQVRKYYMVIT